MTDEELPIIPDEDVEERKPPTDEALKGVRDHAASLFAKRLKAARLLAEAEELAKEIAIIETKVLPDAMRKIGMLNFKLTGGFEVDIEKVITGSITKANEPKAFEWLEKDGSDSIIKHVITISFGKGEEKWAKKFIADMAKRKKPLHAERKDAIHAGTLKAFIRERIEKENAGAIPEEKKLPRDVFGVFEFEKANLVDTNAEAAKKATRKKGAKAKASAEEGIEM